MVMSSENANRTILVIHDSSQNIIPPQVHKCSMPKRCFTDPSIAIAAMGVNADALESQLKTFGFIFEQMCIRDLKAYTLDFDSHISYYRDRYGLESDLVLHLGDGRYALIECKLGSREIEDGASHLIELRRLIREYNKNEKHFHI